MSRVDTLEITWLLPEDLDDGRLAAMLYPGSGPVSSSCYEVLYQELKRKTSPGCCSGRSTPLDTRTGATANPNTVTVTGTG